MIFRHEWKHALNQADVWEIRERLRRLIPLDSHAGEDGKYEIRSLYFDNLMDRALREKLDGVDRREKFRLRSYNGDLSLIHLEKKSKLRGLCSKQSAAVSCAEVQAMLAGDLHWMRDARDRPLVLELFAKMKTQGLRPKTIVDYTREAFIYAPGNVRVTLDQNLRTGLHCTDFFSPSCITVPAGDAPAILEVKWDAYLPDIVRDAVQLRSRQASAFSKYAACRIYG